MNESVIRIRAKKGSPLLTESKFGGYPYWEDGKTIPVNFTGRPLVLLAQINLSDLPPSVLPSSGMLQFFIDTDDLMGMDFNGDMSGYRVVYYPEIKKPLSIERLKGLGFEAFSDRQGEPKPFADIYELTFEEGPEPSMEPEDGRYYAERAAHKILGKPFYAQESLPFGDDQVLLLQIDTDVHRPDGNEITFGDCGTAHFCIEQEELDVLNFDYVRYYWEC